MSPVQGYNQTIRDFIREINEEFTYHYGTGFRDSRFRRNLKKKWLLNGMKRDILAEMDSDIDEDSDQTWPEITEAAQNAEWLYLMHKRDREYLANPVRGYLLSHKFSIDRDDHVIVYTDGACFRNGMPNAQAGIGVWWGDGHPLNVSEPLEEGYPVTNNVAEICSVIKALEIADDHGIGRVAVYTDSQYMINSMTKWIFKWLANGWRKADGEPLKNKQEYRELLFAMEGIDLKWVYVQGHSKCHGNDMADHLARMGAEEY